MERLRAVRHLRCLIYGCNEDGLFASNDNACRSHHYHTVLCAAPLVMNHMERGKRYIFNQENFSVFGPSVFLVA